MRWRGFVAVAAVVSLVPAAAFAQSSPVAAWCGGSYGAGGTNFGECVAVPGGAQVAGQASGLTGTASVATTPEYPAGDVVIKGNKAFYKETELNFKYELSPDRSREIQDSGD